MVVNVFLVVIAPPNVICELMFVLMLKKAKTLYVQAVLAVVFVVLFAQEVY